MGIEACDRILDWPHTPYTLRDKNTLSNDDTAQDKPCNIYDRLPRFASSLQRGSVRTKPSMAFDPGGVCHMGRLPRLTHNSDDKDILQICTFKQDEVEYRAFQQETDTQGYTVFDKLPPSTYSVVNAVKGRRCTACNCGRQRGYVAATGRSGTKVVVLEELAEHRSSNEAFHRGIAGRSRAQARLRDKNELPATVGDF